MILSSEARRALIGAGFASLHIAARHKWARVDEPLADDPDTIRLFGAPTPRNYYGMRAIETLVRNGMLVYTRFEDAVSYRYNEQKEMAERFDSKRPIAAEITAKGRARFELLLRQAKAGKNPSVTRILTCECGPHDRPLAHGRH